MHKSNENGRSMIEMLEKVKQPLNVVLRRQAQVFRCCQSALAPRRNTENQVTEAPLGARRRQCALAQSGRSMIEMLGVLAIIGVLSVGGIMGYSKAMMRYRINKTIEQITYIAGNIRTAFANEQDTPTHQKYQDLSPDAPFLKKMHIVPEDMWKDGEDYPQNVWDGDVEILGEDNGLGKSTFKFSYYDVPEEACIELATHDWRTAGVTVMEIDGYDDGVIIPPATIDDAVKLCNEDGDDLTALFFTFDADNSTPGTQWKQKIDNTRAWLAGN